VCCVTVRTWLNHLHRAERQSEAQSGHSPYDSTMFHAVKDVLYSQPGRDGGTECATPDDVESPKTA
jgi:hypothetical protein